jgi:ubiquinone/menaquinone biosynthesis C-methylase UbiE
MAALSLLLDDASLAEHYERVSADHQFKSGQKLLAALGIARGEQVLDVGCGTGLLAEHAAALVGPSGRAVGVDPLPERIRLAQRRTRGNLEYAVGDAYDLSRFPDLSFDAAYLNAVFHWLPDKAEPLAQLHRVLKPRGRLGIWTIAKDHPSRIRTIKDQVCGREPYVRIAAPQAGGPQPVSVAELETLVRAAGFEPSTIEVKHNEISLPSASEAIDFIESSSFGNFLGHLPEPLRAAAREEIREELERGRTPAGIPLSGASIVAIAFKRWVLGGR